MNSGPSAPIQTVAIERCIAGVRVHLERLAAGHDPFGHLLAVERLARAARAEWCELDQRADSERRRS